jgi:hypothetical protein
MISAQTSRAEEIAKSAQNEAKESAASVQTLSERLSRMEGKIDLLLLKDRGK